MCIIETLDQFMEWARQLTGWDYWDSQYLFRGVTNKCYELEMSISRRLPPTDRNINNLRNITEELIDDAREQGHDEKNGRKLHDLELLAELQHIGAATCLIDFSRSALIALWIACQESSKEPQKDGKVCAIHSYDSDGTPKFKLISHDLVKEDISYFFKPNEMGKYPIYQWTPKPQNNRIIAQHSVFIFGSSPIDADFACVIKQENKQRMLRDLKMLFNIDEDRMYPDLHGFAQRHAHDKCRSVLFRQEYLQRGIRAAQRGDLADAIRYYSNVIEFNLTGSYFTFIAYNNRALAYGAQGNLERAIEDYTRAIELEPNSPLAYSNRGGAYQKQGNLERAIEDCTKAIELEPNNDQAYNNRGGAYYNQGNLEQAIEDYTRAIELEPNNAQAFYNRGTTYHNQGNLEQAIEDYTRAIELEPNNDQAYNNRGEAHQLQDNNDLAEADFRMAEALRIQS